ncbi:MAG: hypothetical protein Q9217_006486 [Psora testacea]
MAIKKKKRPLLLSSTRPTIIQKPSTLSSRKTRSIVRTHHTLRKQTQKALAQGDRIAVADLQGKIEAGGGLRRYQDASIQGQSVERGGDSSKVLMEWLSGAGVAAYTDLWERQRPRMLEVGALRVDNACSRSGLFDMERIDLHSRHHLIKEQDFMQRTIPDPITAGTHAFDIVSLSLVVNFVGDAVERGEMLKRVGRFLRQRNKHASRRDNLFPSLFLVLPAPCVANSRYLHEERLEEMMKTLSYIKVRKKMTAKLVYYLWKYEGQKNDVQRAFKKEEIRPGESRNNFAIILR